MKKTCTLVFFAIIYMAKSTLSAQTLKAEDSMIVDVAILEMFLTDTSFAVVNFPDSKIEIIKKVNLRTGAARYYDLQKSTDEGTVLSMRIQPNGFVSSFTETIFDSTDGSASYFKFKTSFFYNYLRNNKGLYFSKSHYAIKYSGDAKTWPQRRKKVKDQIENAHEAIEDIFTSLHSVACIPKPNISPSRGVGFFICSVFATIPI